MSSFVVLLKIVSKVGRRVDESSPMVDARLQDGSRVNAIIPPLAIDGPILWIRRFGTDPLTADDLLAYREMTPVMMSAGECGEGAAECRGLGRDQSGQNDILNVLYRIYLPARTHRDHRRLG